MTTLPAVDPFQFDYQRHLAAEDLLPEHQDDFQRLIKLLRYAPRFQLLFARIADESYRRLLIGKLQNLLGPPAGRCRRPISPMSSSFRISPHWRPGWRPRDKGER
jgi:hypothetical protein